MVLERGARAVGATWLDSSCAAAMHAAPIAEATPISAWQPPSAADSVALCLHKYPTSRPPAALANLRVGQLGPSGPSE
jgi:hypothetical protein